MKGRSFEQRIATELRTIYDPPTLLGQIVEALEQRQWALHRQLLKQSQVRRSDQGRGAREPDLVCAVCPCWLELQDGGPQYYNPLKKLEQAERDVAESGSELWPAAVCHLAKSSSVQVCLRVRTLLNLADFDLPEREELAFYGAVSTIVDFEAFKELLSYAYSRGIGA